jgi:hypothetical protein
MIVVGLVPASAAIQHMRRPSRMNAIVHQAVTVRHHDVQAGTTLEGNCPLFFCCRVDEIVRGSRVEQRVKLDAFHHHQQLYGLARSRMDACECV